MALSGNIGIRQTLSAVSCSPRLDGRGDGVGGGGGGGLGRGTHAPPNNAAWMMGCAPCGAEPTQQAPTWRAVPSTGEQVKHADHSTNQHGAQEWGSWKRRQAWRAYRGGERSAGV